MLAAGISAAATGRAMDCGRSRAVLLAGSDLTHDWTASPAFTARSSSAPKTALNGGRRSPSAKAVAPWCSWLESA